MAITARHCWAGHTARGSHWIEKLQGNISSAANVNPAGLPKSRRPPHKYPSDGGPAQQKRHRHLMFWHCNKKTMSLQRRRPRLGGMSRAMSDDGVSLVQFRSRASFSAGNKLSRAVLRLCTRLPRATSVFVFHDDSESEIIFFLSFGDGGNNLERF